MKQEKKAEKMKQKKNIKKWIVVRVGRGGEVYFQVKWCVNVLLTLTIESE